MRKAHRFNGAQCTGKIVKRLLNELNVKSTKKYVDKKGAYFYWLFKGLRGAESAVNMAYIEFLVGDTSVAIKQFNL